MNKKLLIILLLLLVLTGCSRTNNKETEYVYYCDNKQDKLDGTKCIKEEVVNPTIICEGGCVLDGPTGSCIKKGASGERYYTDSCKQSYECPKGELRGRECIVTSKYDAKKATKEEYDQMHIEDGSAKNKLLEYAEQYSTAYKNVGVYLYKYRLVDLNGDGNFLLFSLKKDSKSDYKYKFYILEYDESVKELRSYSTIDDNILVRDNMFIYTDEDPTSTTTYFVGYENRELKNEFGVRIKDNKYYYLEFDGLNTNETEITQEKYNSYITGDKLF